MKKILILLLSISGFLNAQTLLDPSIANAINTSCCGGSSSSIIYVDSVSSNSVGDSLIVYKNGTRYAYKYPSGGGSAYTLPVATTSILGGVKDGSGVYIAPDGTISAEKQTFSQNGSRFIVTTYDTAGGVTPQTFTWTAPDFWRSSVSIPVVANTLPDGTNDTIEFIQHRNDIFIGGADGLVRAGQGAGNRPSNTVFGKNALASNTTGISNTAAGNNSLTLNATGNNNSAYGFASLYTNKGDNNNAFGAYSLYSNTTASGNNAFGTQALYFNTTGFSNNAFGYYSLWANTTGANNNAFGTFTLLSNKTGSRNTAIGASALNTNVSGNESIAIGFGALNKATSSSNIGIGSANGSSGAGGAITTGTENIAIGSNGTGAGSGDAPLSAMLIGAGNYNTCIGSGASRIEGSRNVTLGWNNADIGVANDNVFIGSRVMTAALANWIGTNVQKITTNKNTFVGADVNFKSTAKNLIGDANTALGYGALVDVTGVTNSTTIGANSAVTKSNQVVLGDGNVVEILLSGKLAIDVNAIFGAADGTPIVVKTVGGIKTITIQ
jgi:hypothetical protein